MDKTRRALQGLKGAGTLNLRPHSRCNGRAKRLSQLQQVHAEMQSHELPPVVNEESSRRLLIQIRRALLMCTTALAAILVEGRDFLLCIWCFSFLFFLDTLPKGDPRLWFFDLLLSEERRKSI
jgi:hypothetical protein